MERHAHDHRPMNELIHASPAALDTLHRQWAQAHEALCANPLKLSMARGVLLPGGASDDLVALYAERFEKALQDPAAIESLTKMGSSIRFVGGQDYADWWADQAAQWEKVARDIGIYMVN